MNTGSVVEREIEVLEDGVVVGPGATFSASSSGPRGSGRRGRDDRPGHSHRCARRRWRRGAGEEGRAGRGAGRRRPCGATASTGVSSQKIRFERPLLPSAAATERYLAAAREARWFSNAGPCWHLLRERLSAAVGCECVSVVNATLGLIVALAAVVGRATRPGRAAALVSSFAFAASAQAAVSNGSSRSSSTSTPITGTWHRPRWNVPCRCSTERSLRHCAVELREPRRCR